jgi:hypothetical protein
VLTIRATLWVSFSKKEKCKNYNAVGNLVGKVLLRYKLRSRNWATLLPVTNPECSGV